LILHYQKLTNDWGLHRLTGLVCVLVTKRALTFFILSFYLFLIYTLFSPILILFIQLTATLRGQKVR